MCSKSLSRIFDSEKKKTFFLLTTPKDRGSSGFTLYLSDMIQCWYGEISKYQLETMALKLKKKFNDFIFDNNEALLNGTDSAKWSYSFTVSESSLLFSWKKVLSDTEIKVQYGHLSLELQDEPATIIGDMLAQTILLQKDLIEKIDQLEIQNECLSTQRDNAIEKLDNWMQQHEDREKDLFSKFVIILNNKKQKIRELYDEINHLTQKSNNLSSDDINETNVLSGILDNNEDPSSSLLQRENSDSLDLITDQSISNIPVGTNRKRTRVRQSKPQISDFSVPVVKRNSRKSSAITSEDSCENLDADQLLNQL